MSLKEQEKDCKWKVNYQKNNQCLRGTSSEHDSKLDSMLELIVKGQMHKYKTSVTEMNMGVRWKSQCYLLNETET